MVSSLPPGFLFWFTVFLEIVGFPLNFPQTYSNTQRPGSSHFFLPSPPLFFFSKGKWLLGERHQDVLCCRIGREMPLKTFICWAAAASLTITLKLISWTKYSWLIPAIPSDYRCIPKTKSQWQIYIASKEFREKGKNRIQLTNLCIREKFFCDL